MSAKEPKQAYGDSDGAAADGTKKSRQKRQMEEGDLLGLIKAHEEASLGSSVSSGSTTGSGNPEDMPTLEMSRANALDAFMARPLGNEVENHSQIVIPELRDTVLWIMPQLMRMFAASREIFRFDAEGANDKDAAQLETQVINHVIMNENPGFLILYDYFWDALMLHNGYVEVYYDTKKRTKVETYSQLLQDELVKVMQKRGDDEDVEVLAQREYSVAIPGPGGQPTQVPVFDIKIRRTGTVGMCCIEAVPAEEMRVSPSCRGGLDGSKFTSRVTEKTRSDLIAEGFDRDLVDSLEAGQPSWMEVDAQARNQSVDESQDDNPTMADFAMQEIEFHKVVMNVDWDGDGIAELRQIIVAGDKILDNEEIEETCFASTHAIRMPHRHSGISLYDVLMDLQVLKSTLTRMGIDNLALANQTRIGADWQAVNIDDLMTVRAGGVIRTKGNPQEALFPIVQPSNVTSQILPVLEYCDSMREMRTGVGHSSMGLDADELQNVTKGGQLAAMSAASLKIELVARLLAEGVGDCGRKIHGVLRRHHDRPLEFELAGKFVESDPTQWGERTRVSARVGLGSGNREEARANGVMLGQAQGALQPYGLVGPKQVWNSFKDYVSLLGYEHPEKYAMDPDSDEYKQFQASKPQTPPDPRIVAANIKAKSVQDQEGAQTQRTAIEANVALTKAKTDQVHEQTLAIQQQLHDAMQSNLDRQHEHQQNQHGHGMDAAQSADDMRERRFEALLKAFTTMAAAEITAKTQVQTAQMGAVANEADQDA